MNEEFLKFVKLHNIDMEIAEQAYADAVEYGSRYPGYPPTIKTRNRDAMYQLRLITGIKY